MPTLLNAVTTTGAGKGVQINRPKRTYQANVAGTGSVSATVVIEGSNDGVDFFTLGTITLSGTGRAADGFVSDAQWDIVRGNVTAISGTGAAVTAIVSVLGG